MVKHGGGSVVVWEAFSNCNVGDLHQVKGKLNQTGYYIIQKHHMIPSGTRFVGQGLSSAEMKIYFAKYKNFQGNKSVCHFCFFVLNILYSLRFGP